MHALTAALVSLLALASLFGTPRLGVPATASAQPTASSLTSGEKDGGTDDDEDDDDEDVRVMG